MGISVGQTSNFISVFAFPELASIAQGAEEIAFEQNHPTVESIDINNQKLSEISSALRQAGVIQNELTYENLTWEHLSRYYYNSTRYTRYLQRLNRGAARPMDVANFVRRNACSLYAGYCEIQGVRLRGPFNYISTARPSAQPSAPRSTTRPPHPRPRVASRDAGIDASSARGSAVVSRRSATEGTQTSMTIRVPGVDFHAQSPTVSVYVNGQIARNLYVGSVAAQGSDSIHFTLDLREAIPRAYTIRVYAAGEQVASVPFTVTEAQE
jgi:hypothetical protein